MGEPTTVEAFLGPAIYVFSLVLLGMGIRVAAERVKVLARPVKIGFRFINVFVLWVVLPIVVFTTIAPYDFSSISKIGNALVLALVGMVVCFLAATAISHATKKDRKTTIAITMNAAFMNVAYLGLPMIYALMCSGALGPEALGPAALFAMAIGIPHLILGVTFAASAAEKRVTPRFVFENFLTFPAAFALIIAMLVVAVEAPVLKGVYLPGVINTFAGPFFALMLLFVGFQIPLARPRKYLGELATVGALRFLVCPLVTYLLMLVLRFNLNATLDLNIYKTTMIQATMPPAVFNLILAHKYGLDLKLYGALVFYLTIISLFIALPILYFLIF